MPLFDGGVTWAAAIQAFAALGGIVFIAYQVTQLRKNIRGATQDRLYAHYTELCKLILQKPYLYPYYYENEKYVDSDSNPKDLKDELNLVSEVVLGLVEHSKLQEKNMPADSWENCWLPFAMERLDKS